MSEFNFRYEGPAASAAFCAGYVRVSTNRQDLSVEVQTAAIERGAEYHTGGAPDEIFSDPDTSGSIPFAEREGASRLIAAVRAAGAAGKAVTIIVTKVDRLGRDTVDVSNTASLFDSLRARLILLDINVDTRTAMGRAFMQIAAVFAELERARIRERIQDGLDRKRHDGEVIGSVPFGWDAEETGEVTAKGVKIRRLVANADEQKWILHIARRRAAGASLNSIAKDLNRAGVATKRRGERLNMRSSKSSPLVTKRTSGLWQAGQVKKIFQNKKVQAFLSQFEASPFPVAVRKDCPSGERVG